MPWNSSILALNTSLRWPLHWLLHKAGSGQVRPLLIEGETIVTGNRARTGNKITWSASNKKIRCQQDQNWPRSTTKEARETGQGIDRCTGWFSTKTWKYLTSSWLCCWLGSGVLGLALVHNWRKKSLVTDHHLFFDLGNRTLSLCRFSYHSPGHTASS